MITIWKPVLSAVAALLLAASPAYAQSTAEPEPTAEAGAAEQDGGGMDFWKHQNKFEFGIFAGVFIPGEEHGLYNPDDAVYRAFDAVAPEVGLRIGYLPLPWLGIEAEAAAMSTRTDTDLGVFTYGIRGHLLLQYPWIVVPFLVVGGGVMGASSESDAVGSDADGAFHWGVGVKYYPTDWFAVRLDLRHDLSVDGEDDEVGNHFEVLAGISFVLGGDEPPAPADADGDGVADDKDKCPQAAAKTEDGCLPDADGDGVADEQDKCPQIAAETEDGCPPDADGDGVPDDKDKCPQVAAKTEDGCPPDGDGDGVADDKDKCPQVAAKTEDGCPPDGDGDGVADDKDKCPQVAAKTEDGCPPDGDGDGITDAEDKCPAEAETFNGFQDSDGCPDKMPKAIKRFTGAIKGIYFASGKGKIQKRSYKILSRAVKVLEKFPELKLQIEGHTDDRGKRKFNLDLSQRRAEAVVKFLVDKGIAQDRLKAVGFGPDKPVANNKKAAGRAKNRRIEFSILK